VTVRGEDGLLRPLWASTDPLMRDYYDTEWGMPVRDERGMFERLSLEAFQSGLSWATILRKRPAFREAFAGFRIDDVARFGARDVRRLLGDAGIVRNRQKIEATIANARAAADLRDDGESLAALVWGAAPRGRRRAPRSTADLPATTPESTALARELKRRGFRFLGPTTVYATMQACGVVNDHVLGCVVRGEVERQRRAALATVPRA
jgi:DNA-3-methyladenine glycosylase I